METHFCLMVRTLQRFSRRPQSRSKALTSNYQSGTPSSEFFLFMNQVPIPEAPYLRCYSRSIRAGMPTLNRLNYYRRVFRAYLLPGESQLSFWHDSAELNRDASTHSLGEYYMTFAEKAVYAGPHDARGIPMLNYRGVIGMQHNPIAIAQWGLGIYNVFC